MKRSLCLRFGKRHAFSVCAFVLICSAGSIGRAQSVSVAAPEAASKLTVVSEVPKLKKPKVGLGVSVTARRIDDKFVKSNTAGPLLELRAQHAFGEKLSASLSIFSQITTGTASSLFTSEGQPSTSFFVNDASVAIQPLESLTLRGGILETKFSTNQSLFSSRGFPGLSESAKFGSEKWNALFAATQTLPSASGVSKNYDGNSAQAYLFLHSAGINAGEPEAKLSASASVTHFLFADLPANAAQDSRFLGNSVVGLGASAARFMHEFNGYEGSLSLRSRLNSKFKLEIKSSVLTNLGAPSGKNLGYNSMLVPTIESGNFEIKPEIGYFYNESDTLPAAYTSSGVGNNNRQGILAGLRAKFKEQNVTLSTRWVQADKIAPNPYTADRTIVTFGLETSYDIL